MTLTLLLDLDGTLLSNSVQTFVPSYMKLLTAHVAPYVEPQKFFDALMFATQQMILNSDPECLLVDVFEANFYPRLRVTQDMFHEVVDQFYIDIFPQLKPLTEVRPEAVKLVNQAFSRNYRVAIATNPLFPLTAIEQRLAWAGLPRTEYPFSIVPSYESVHFAKPNPSFLAELMARLGWPDEPAIMVGDEIDNDVRCAVDLGLPAYLVDGTLDSEDFIGDTYVSGGLEDLLNWVDAQPRDSLMPDFNSPSALLAILRSTPAALKSMSMQIDHHLWAERQQPEEWCQTEIICHLRDVESEVNLPRIIKVLDEVNPFIPGQDTDPWAEDRRYINQNGPHALKDFIIARKRLLELISLLPFEDWQRPARHAIFGPTNLQELLSIIAGHDRLHIHQLYTFINTINRRADSAGKH